MADFEKFTRDFPLAIPLDDLIIRRIKRDPEFAKVMSDWFDSEGWHIVIHKSKAPETGYWGEVPAMPGCASQGATRAECRAYVLEAALGCFEAYLQFKMLKPRP